MAQVTTCAVCGKPIDPKAARYADVNRVTKEKRQVHVECQPQAK
jgi:hypothetical protein